MSAQTPFPEPSSDLPYGAPPPQQYGMPPLSSWGRRAAAALLDGLFALLLVGPLLIVLAVVLYASMDERDAETAINLLFSGIFLLFALLYYSLTMRRAGHNGQTWGKQILGIRVIKESGEPFTAGSAIVREVLVKNILMWLCFIVGILDYLSPLWDDRNQAWHDKIVNTLVVHA